VTYLRTVFPEPAINSGVVSGKENPDGDEILTFPVNPKQGARRLPIEGVLSGAPRRSTHVMSTGCGVEIDR
jgi:hypothetical protein